MSFYHKYRPQKFSDLMGQQHVKKTLSNAILHNKVGHAYLFSGPRGAGKTTVARILAKSLNCGNKASNNSKEKTKAVDFEPCNKCISCQEITSGHSLDVIEIDAASNRGIDEIRELRDKIKFAPSKSTYKVFIIDEVHMLTKEAFNALLKTLEEPPQHAIFVMATTEFHKIPATILSRVQSFNFKRASIDDILEYLNKIIASEKIDIAPEALRLIALSGDGSYRDATSVLDQIASSSLKSITLADVESVLGIADQKNIVSFLDALSRRDVKDALSVINYIFTEGYDLGEFNKQLVEYLRRIIIYKNDSTFFENTEFDKEQKEVIKNTGDKFTLGEALELINLFISVGLDIKSNSLPQLPLEIAAIKICGINSKGEDKKMEKPEKKIDNISKVETSNIDPPQKEETKVESKSEINVEEVEKKAVDTKRESENSPSKNATLGTVDLKGKWSSVLNEMSSKNRSLYLILKESMPIGIENDKFTIGIKFKLYAERLNEKKNYQTIAQVIEKIYGKNYPLGFLVSDKLMQKIPDQTKEKKEESADPKINSLVNDTLEIFGS